MKLLSIGTIIKLSAIDDFHKTTDELKYPAARLIVVSIPAANSEVKVGQTVWTPVIHLEEVLGCEFKSVVRPAAKPTPKNETAIDEVKAQIISDLDALGKLQFKSTSPMYREFFGDSLDGKSVARFVYERIKMIAVADRIKISRTDPNVVATCADGLMTIYPTYFRISQVDRWMVLVHEAQHCEIGTLNQHVLCPSTLRFQFDGETYSFRNSPDVAGKLACDSDRFGAHVIESVFSAAVARSCLNCSPEMREEALKKFVLDGLFRILDPALSQELLDSALDWEEAKPFIKDILSRM